MAVLEKIRSHGVLMLIIIGGAMVLFIVSDFINSGISRHSTVMELFIHYRKNGRLISGRSS